jgi:hypothetical protein
MNCSRMAEQLWAIYSNSQDLEVSGFPVARAAAVVPRGGGAIAVRTSYHFQPPEHWINVFLQQWINVKYLTRVPRRIFLSFDVPYVQLLRMTFLNTAHHRVLWMSLLCSTAEGLLSLTCGTGPICKWQ